VGASDAQGIAITQGIQPGERVVVMSAMPVKDGQVVRTGGGRSGGKDSGQAGGASGAARASASRA
jgi:hypothetical protein